MNPHMKAIFLVFHGFEPHNGISKKIFYQVKGLKECDVDTQLCYLDIRGQQHYRMLDGEVLEHFGTGIIARIKKRIQYAKLLNYAASSDVKFIYVRYDHNANPFLIRFFNRLRRTGIKVIMEIPTFPYDQEYIGLPSSLQRKLMMDKCFRKSLVKHVDRIVTFSADQQIWGVPTINISNGIDFDAVKMKSHINDTTSQIRMIGVADIHAWHGFDRIIAGLADYYSMVQNVEIFFDIVGGGVPSVMDSLKKAVMENHLENYVQFHGHQSGDELDQLFEHSDIGVGSLARHRSNVHNIKTLKNREYAARGIPFIYSEIDDDFENMPYILKIPADETPVNISKIVVFRQSTCCIPSTIRDSIILNLSWKNQMQKVIDRIKILDNVH